jgi:uncharacterized damage-inducible protein DinB
MNMKWSLIPALALVAVPALHAQASPNVGAARALYEMNEGFLVKTAEQVAEDVYGFKPTPEVRTLGQILGHVASANFMFCATAMGEKSPATTDYEKAASKAEIVKGLKDAFAYCDKAYQMTDAKAAEAATVFGAKQNRLYALMFNMAHNNEHYGNLVTYMRLKGITPPSSQRGGM